MPVTINNIEGGSEATMLFPKVSIVDSDYAGGSQNNVWATFDKRELFSEYLSRETHVSTRIKSTNVKDETSTPSTSIKSEISDNLLKLVKEFNSESSSNRRLQSFDKLFVATEYIKVAMRLSELNFYDAVFETVRDKGFRFTMLFDGEKMLLVDKNLDYSVFGNDEIIFSLFVNRELIASNAVDIKEFIPSFKEYLNQ